MDARGWRLILDEHLASAIAYDVPELLLTSYGGSGLNMLADWVQQYRRVVTHLWTCQLCHTVHSLGIYPALVVVGHPTAAWHSMDRRGIRLLNTWKILGYVPDAFDPLAIAMLTYLQTWAARDDVAIVKYDAIWDCKQRICDHLQLPSDRFPVYRKRLSQPTGGPVSLEPAIELYGSLPSWRPACRE